jgi:hypothetical protein
MLYRASPGHFFRHDVAVCDACGEPRRRRCARPPAPALRPPHALAESLRAWLCHGRCAPLPPPARRGSRAMMSRHDLTCHAAARSRQVRRGRHRRRARWLCGCHQGRPARPEGQLGVCARQQAAVGVADREPGAFARRSPASRPARRSVAPASTWAASRPRLCCTRRISTTRPTTRSPRSASRVRARTRAPRACPPPRRADPPGGLCARSQRLCVR